MRKVGYKNSYCIMLFCFQIVIENIFQSHYETQFLQIFYDNISEPSVSRWHFSKA